MKKQIAPRRTPPRAKTALCPLCRSVGDNILWRDKYCRIVAVKDPDYAGYCRVIWNTHVKEMTDLPVAQRAHCMRVVFAVEKAVRAVFNPDKVNLASFGNMAPHLHWHIIPRFVGDAHFPSPVWGKRRRSTAPNISSHASVKWRSLLKMHLVQIL